MTYRETTNYTQGNTEMSPETFFKPYVTIFESELQYIARLCWDQGNIETGGELHGLQTHAARPVIFLATGPGPEAVHQVAHFQQDIQYVRQTNHFLWTNFGIQIRGPYHSHHGLGLREPSQPDNNNSHTIALKNGYNNLTQFIITFESFAQSPFTFLGDQPRLIYSKHQPITPNDRDNRKIFVQINSFLYMNKMASKPIQCPLKVLPGVSPVRIALGRHSNWNSLEKRCDFPNSRILFQPYQDLDPATQSENILPERIGRQIASLPNWILDNLTCFRKDDLFILIISFPGKHHPTAYLGYVDSYPYQLKQVYLKSEMTNGRPINVTNEVLRYGAYTRLSVILNLLARYIDFLESGTERKVSKADGESIKLRPWNAIRKSKDDGTYLNHK